MLKSTIGWKRGELTSLFICYKEWSNKSPLYGLWLHVIDLHLLITFSTDTCAFTWWELKITWYLTIETLFFRFEKLNGHYTKTTCPILMKFTAHIEWVIKTLNMKSQVILKFLQNLWIFDFLDPSILQGVYWYPNILKQLKTLHF